MQTMTSTSKATGTVVVACPHCSIGLRISSDSRLSAAITCPRCAHRSTVADFYARFARQKYEGSQSSPQSVIEPTGNANLGDTLIVAPQANRGIASLYGHGGSRYALQLGPNYIGKHPQDKVAHLIKLSQADAIGTVSRSHCIIEVRHSQSGGHTYHIVDNQSLNGTYLEGQRLSPGVSTPITLGQTIILGNLCRLTLKQEEA